MKLLEKYLALFFASLLLSLFAWHAWDDMAAPAIAAFWGIVFITPALIDFVPWCYQRLKWQAEAELNGIHYEFGATRVRVFYAANLIWIASDDLHRALGVTQVQGGSLLTIPGTRVAGIAEPQVHSYVASLNSPESSRFIVWFEQCIAKPLRTRIDHGLPITETVKRTPV